MTEAGHRCTVRRCNEHIVEVHHVDENRENNNPDNLVVLCDKHHKLAHQGKISRKDLNEYKRLLFEQPVPTVQSSYDDFDKKLLKKINEIFPFEFIQNLQNEIFGSFVRQELIDPIVKFFYHAEDPLFKFKNEKLENLKLELLKKAKVFNYHFSQQSAGRQGGYDYINLNEKQYQPKVDIEYWEQYIIKTSELANDFCDSMLILRGELRNV